MTDERLREFVRESNRIEGIEGGVRPGEAMAHVKFLALLTLTVEDVRKFVAVVQPDAVLRDKAGLDVRVGSYHPPLGTTNMPNLLDGILEMANHGGDPWEVHCRYESLHPFTDGNGRSGRVLWAWRMLHSGHDPFSLPFLHRFYYQSLEAFREIG